MASRFPVDALQEPHSLAEIITGAIEGLAETPEHRILGYRSSRDHNQPRFVDSVDDAVVSIK